VTDPAPFADTELAAFVRSFADLPRMTAGDDPVALRRATDERLADRPPGPAMPTVDVVAGGCPARVYRPTDDARDVVLYLHGGGWTIGGLESHDRACRRLAATGDVVVVALDYRLAPEHPAPAAVNDAVAALEWIASAPAELGQRSGAVAIAGDSAGGTVAALAALQLRGTDAAPSVLGLVYANTDLAADDGSMVTNAHGFVLDVDDVRWFNRQWVPDPSRWSDPRVSPLHVDDLRGLADTVVVTCELDPLRDQGEAFAARLVQAGVTVTSRRELGMVHNFLLWDLVSPACAAAGDRVALDLAAALRRAAGWDRATLRR
jgi:acetyl esterase